MRCRLACVLGGHLGLPLGLPPPAPATAAASRWSSVFAAALASRFAPASRLPLRYCLSPPASRTRLLLSPSFLRRRCFAICRLIRLQPRPSPLCRAPLPPPSYAAWRRLLYAPPPVATANCGGRQRCGGRQLLPPPRHLASQPLPACHVEDQPARKERTCCSIVACSCPTLGEAAVPTPLRWRGVRRCNALPRPPSGAGMPGKCMSGRRRLDCPVMPRAHCLCKQRSASDRQRLSF
eukprot:SAG11_NODE_3215_length_2605_cov_2.049880_2_plen_236_part_00